MAKKSAAKKEDLDELDRDDEPTVTDNRGKLAENFVRPPERKPKPESKWGVTDPSKIEFDGFQAMLNIAIAADSQAGKDEGVGKRAALGHAAQLETEHARGVKADPDLIASLKSDAEESLSKQLAHDKSARKKAKRHSLNNAKRSDQADREADNPNPSYVKFVGHETEKWDADKFKLLRTDKIGPTILEIDDVHGRRPDLDFVLKTRIPQAVREAQKRFTGDIAAQLFARMESKSKTVLSVPRVRSFFSPQIGEVKETIDPIAWEAITNLEGLTKRFERIAREYAKQNNIKSIPEAEAAKRLKKLRADLLAFERLEEAMIRAAARQGIHVLRRREASLESIFGYEWRK